MTRLAAPILVATDASDDAHAAMRVAASLAGGSGSPLHVVHVWQRPFTYGVPSQLIAGPGFENEAGGATLDAERMFLETCGTPVSGAHLRHGSPALAILAVADVVRAGLVVVGRRGLGAVRRVVMGSVSDGVIRQTTVPVLVVHGEHWPPSRVVVGEDGGAEARGAADIAEEVAAVTGAPMVLMRALPQPWQALDPAAQDGTALLVVGHRRPAAGRRPHGDSLAERLLHHAAGSVLIVPAAVPSAAAVLPLMAAVPRFDGMRVAQLR